MDFKDYYATLGVAKTATDKELKQAYRKLARKHHPDVNPGDKSAEARFKEINEAYEVLGDPEKRRKYDELGANWRAYEQAERAGGPNPFEQGGWSVNVGGGPGGFRTMSEEEMQEMFGTDNPFSDFFNTFFGGAAADPAGRRTRGGRARARKGRDLEHEIDLTLEEADQGVTRRLSIKHDGHARTVDFRVPPGVGDGSRIRVTGEGERGQSGAASGDLYLRVRLLPHTVFERKGRDLYMRAPVPVTIAVLGGEVEVPVLGGRTLRLKVPPGTQNGQIFRLRGQGMTLSGKPGERSDLYATLDVQVPREITPEERAHYEALAALAGKKHSAA
jgi:curved DNA-binding protein